MNHLLIFNMIPDETDYFILIPGKHDDLIALAEASHGYVINGEDNDAIHALNEKLIGPNGESPEGVKTDHCSKLPIPDGPFAAVYVCTFLL